MSTAHSARTCSGESLDGLCRHFEGVTVLETGGELATARTGFRSHQSAQSVRDLPAIGFPGLEPVTDAQTVNARAVVNVIKTERTNQLRRAGGHRLGHGADAAMMNHG